MEHGRGIDFYKKFYKPSSQEYAEILKRHGKLYAMGEHCQINMGVNITDPAYVKIGNNVILSDCNIFGHDGVIGMLNIAYNTQLDCVGKVVIHDNVYIGHNAIVMPNVSIGPNAIIGAGAVVTKDVMPGDIVGGVPAKVIGKVDELVVRLKKETDLLPWAHIIKNRQNSFDPSVEGELCKLRVKHFYGDI